jgi:hypothetical protein
MSLLPTLLARGFFKGTAFLLAIAAIAAIWTYDASIIVSGEDMNLALIKLVAAHLPEGYGSKTEAALRLFGADKAFLFTETVGVIKLLMLGIGGQFRSHRLRAGI